MALIKLYIGRDQMDAHHVRTLLEDEGIQATVMGENLSIARGYLPMTENTLPSVWIDDSDIDKATPIIADLNISADPTLPPWTCAHCHESIEGHFDVCWNCGTSRSGDIADTFTPVEDFIPDTHCRRCGYDLRGLDSNRCPECGERFE
jgi:hypothetical protein